LDCQIVSAVVAQRQSGGVQAGNNHTHFVSDRWWWWWWITAAITAITAAAGREGQQYERQE
jgi:hypothetical protein